MGGLTGLGDNVWDGLKWVGGKIWEGLQWVWGKIMGGLTGLGGKIWDGLTGLGGKIWDGLIGLGGWVAEKLSGLSGEIMGGLTGLGNKIWEGLQWLWNTLIWPILEPVFTWVGNKIEWGWNLISGVVKNLWNNFQAGVSAVFTFLGGKLDDVVNAIVALPGAMAGAAVEKTARETAELGTKVTAAPARGAAWLFDNTVGHLPKVWGGDKTGVGGWMDKQVQKIGGEDYGEMVKKRVKKSVDRASARGPGPSETAAQDAMAKIGFNKEFVKIVPEIDAGISLQDAIKETKVRVADLGEKAKEEAKIMAEAGMLRVEQIKDTIKDTNTTKIIEGIKESGMLRAEQIKDTIKDTNTTKIIEGIKESTIQTIEVEGAAAEAHLQQAVASAEAHLRQTVAAAAASTPDRLSVVTREFESRILEGSEKARALADRDERTKRLRQGKIEISEAQRKKYAEDDPRRILPKTTTFFSPQFRGEIPYADSAESTLKKLKTDGVVPGKDTRPTGRWVPWKDTRPMEKRPWPWKGGLPVAPTHKGEGIIPPGAALAPGVGTSVAKPFTGYRPTTIAGSDTSKTDDILTSSEGLLQKIEQNTRGGMGNTIVNAGQRGGGQQRGSSPNTISPNTATVGAPKKDSHYTYVDSDYIERPNTLVS